MISKQFLSWVNDNIQSRDVDSKSSFHQLSNLSIVIPTFCRQDYILRQISYWASSNASIIIMDGSSEPLEDSIIFLISKYNNIKYFHSEISYVDRIRTACDYINTKYAICLADDDIYLKEGLCKAIDFMDTKESSIACISMPLGIDYDLEKKQAIFFPYGDSLDNYQVNNNNAVKRIEYAMNNYRTATSYALFRSINFKAVWYEINSSSCLEATEYEHAITTYLFGRLENCQSLYWLRSHECEPVDSVIDGSRETTFNLWCEDPLYANEYSSFVERLTKRIIKKSKIEKTIAHNVVKNSITSLNGKHEGLMNDSFSLNLAQSLLTLLEFIPLLKRIVRYLRLTKFGIKLRSFIRLLIRRGHSSQRARFESLMQINKKVLKNIIVFVNKFHSLK